MHCTGSSLLLVLETLQQCTWLAGETCCAVCAHFSSRCWWHPAGTMTRVLLQVDVTMLRPTNGLPRLWNAATLSEFQSSRSAVDAALHAFPPPPRAMYSLGRNYQHGRGTGDVDDEAAVGLYRRAAEAGDARSVFQLGWMLREGRGVPAPDEHAAVQYFLQAAAAGSHDGMIAAAQAYALGEGGLARDAAAAQKLAKEALGLAMAEWEQEVQDAELRDVAAAPEEVWEFPTEHCSSAVAEASFVCGLCLEHGGGSSDPSLLRQSFQHYLTAARHGHAPGAHNVGVMLDCGFGIPADPQAAVAWFQHAADRGDHASMYALGLAHRYGRGVEQSNEAAVKWYRAAAEAGHARAWNKLGWMLQLGCGVPAVDATGALQAYRRGAELGSLKAMCHLGALHRDGGLGLSVDSVAARRWFQAAAEAGSELALEQLGHLEKGVPPVIAGSAPSRGAAAVSSPTSG